ncbi:hypothetical protein L6452_18975 [Arctium lappa]|uniref:Uncharacterized protein n=1 Tax=Arctium lappa TaxID=4217 RepID=A0ACB9B7P9_ARCLA|nr:hypothetical protein L6452_18975 [Arctium lappa]
MPPSPRPRSFFSAILGYNITNEFTFCLVSNFEQKDVEKAGELGEQKSRLRSGLAGSIHDHHSSIKHSEVNSFGVCRTTTYERRQDVEENLRQMHGSQEYGSDVLLQRLLLLDQRKDGRKKYYQPRCLTFVVDGVCIRWISGQGYLQS